MKIDPPIWIKQKYENMDVITFGKSPEQTQSDIASGVSRFGGKWRQPNYLQSYMCAARILLSEGLKTNMLDDIGLPLFYIQRHTTELLIKQLLSWIFDIDALDEKNGELVERRPTAKQRRNFKREHSLKVLLDDLKMLINDYGFKTTPASLSKLVEMITHSEVTETWSRYSTSEREKRLVKHVEGEHSVPIQRIQEALELAVSECLMQQFNDEGVYEADLYESWLDKARKAGVAG